jgi:hypothetical protein
MGFVRKFATVVCCVSGLALLAGGCGSTPTRYYGVIIRTPSPMASATLRWVVSGSGATGTLTLGRWSRPMAGLPAGVYSVAATVRGVSSGESVHGTMRLGQTTLTVAGTTESPGFLVLAVQLPGGKVTLALRPEVPGTYSGTAAAPPVTATLSWEKSGATATGRLTIGPHPAGTFPLDAGSYPTTLQFSGDGVQGTLRYGGQSRQVSGSVSAQEVLLSVVLPGGPVHLAFRSVGSQSYTGYAS